jgi:hypothetical protein
VRRVQEVIEDKAKEIMSDDKHLYIYKFCAFSSDGLAHVLIDQTIYTYISKIAKKLAHSLSGRAGMVQAMIYYSLYSNDRQKAS